jgi:hypothetical protein
MRPEIGRYEKNLWEQVNESALYAALAAAEVDPIRKDLFLQLSQAEAAHAQLWRERVTAAGGHDDHDSHDDARRRGNNCRLDD